jgi:hypothetical protein
MFKKTEKEDLKGLPKELIKELNLKIGETPLVHLVEEILKEEGAGNMNSVLIALYKKHGKIYGRKYVGRSIRALKRKGRVKRIDEKLEVYAYIGEEENNNS